VPKQPVPLRFCTHAEAVARVSGVQQGRLEVLRRESERLSGTLMRMLLEFGFSHHFPARNGHDHSDMSSRQKAALIWGIITDPQKEPKEVTQ